MKILLISPLDPKIPSNLRYLMGGESTYTKTLLENPPERVEFVHFEKALSLGLIKYSVWHELLSMLMKLRILPTSAGIQCFKINYDFDLIHLHAYSGKFSGKKIPVVMGNSSSNILFLRDYLNWSEVRIKLQISIKRFVYSFFNIYDQDVNLMDSKKLIVFSHFAKRFHIRQGVFGNKIEVIYPGIPRTNEVKKEPIKKNTEKINILFAGVWFERKGGRILLEAYKILRQRHKNIKLTLLGPLPKDIKIEDNSISQKDFVPYKMLLEKYYPEASIFVLVPPKAEGFGMVAIEAMSFGIPVIASSVYALPELVEDKKTGLLVKPNSIEDLVEKLEILIKNSHLRQKMSQNAKKSFAEKFQINKSNEQLLKVYSCVRIPRNLLRG